MRSLQILTNVIYCHQRIRSVVEQFRSPRIGGSVVTAVFRGKESSLMEATQTRAAAIAEQRTSNEHLGTRIGAGVLIILGGLGLAGCATAESHSPVTSSSASAESTPSAEATPTNDMTNAEFSTWASDCAITSNESLLHEMGNLTQANVDYFRQAFAEDKDLGVSVQNDCDDLADDLGGLLAKDQSK